MLLQKQQIEDAVLSNPAIREFMDDEGAEPELAADVIDLVRLFSKFWTAPGPGQFWKWTKRPSPSVR